MSHLLESIKDKPFNFVIPVAGKCFKSRIGFRDKVLLLSLNKGYIEADSLETCYYVTVYLETEHDGFFIPVGNIEKIKLSDTDDVVYRQRIYFKSLSLFLRVVKSLNCQMVVPNTFKVTTNSLLDIINELPILERYAKAVKSDVDTWLTNVCLILLYDACKMTGVSDRINLDDSVYALANQDGYLNRSPLLCGTHSAVNNISSVFRLENTEDTRFYSNDIFGKSIVDGNKTLNCYGYTDKNVRRDIKRGVFRF